MSVTADEINFLIRRHLQEAGYSHTAFIFSQESLLDQSNIQVKQLPSQALITILKKGMLYMQLEKGINEKAKVGQSPETILLSLLETVHNEDPIIPTKTSTRVPPIMPQVQSPRPPQPQVDLQVIQFPSNAALILKGHFADVYCGAWTHDGKFLATGSGDATAIIWEIQNHKYYQHFILDHATQQERNGKDIATLAWNRASTLLATGCYDGTVRLWSNIGELKFVLVHHTEPVFTVQFSPDGLKLLSGSADRTIIVWNVITGEMIQCFTNHHSRALDVDWLDNDTFASSSGDYTIAISTIGQLKPRYILEGHRGEVNKIEWDSSGKMLASCSDDKSVRVWSPFENAQTILLNGHTHHVYTIKWAPGEEKLLLASGSFDFTVRLWDVATKSCRFLLQKHTQPIYTICFSPHGRFFVSGGIDSIMNLWRTSDAALIASYQAKSGIFDAQWDPTGQNISMCLSDATVSILSTSEILMYRE